MRPLYYTLTVALIVTLIAFFKNPLKMKGPYTKLL